MISEEQAKEILRPLVNKEGLLLSYFRPAKELKDFLNQKFPGKHSQEQIYLLFNKTPKKCVICGADCTWRSDIENPIGRHGYYKVTCDSLKCISKLRGINTSNAIKNGRRTFGKGKDNLAYGKSSKDLLIEKYGKEEGTRKYEEKLQKMHKTIQERSSEEKERLRKLAATAKNPNKGIPLEQQFINRLGEKEGKIQYQQYRERHRKVMHDNFSGPNNPQFGKPAHHNSGSGYSGWYKGSFFRSLLELSFVINFLEKQNISWTSGEVKKFKIPYTWKDKNRNYFPDFITDTSIIEIKPKALTDTIQNQKKFEAAKEVAISKGLEFKVYTEEDFEGLSESEILSLYKTNTITFTKTALKKFEENFILKK